MQRLRAAGDLALEPKQAWTNVADFTSRGIDAVNFGPGATRYAHRRDEQVEIAALERCFGRSGRSSRVPSDRARLPHPRAPDDVSVRAPERGGTPRRGAGIARDRLRHGRPARADGAVDPATRSSPGCASGWATRPRSGCPSCARPIAGWAGRRFGATLDPDTEVIPTLGQQGGDLQLRARRRRTPTAARDTVAFTDPGLPGLRARRALRARAPARLAAARGARLPARPGRDRRGDVEPARGLLGQLPEQPHLRDGAARVLRAARRARARARLRRSPPTRPTRSSGSASRPRRRSSSTTGPTSSSSTRSRSAAR